MQAALYRDNGTERNSNVLQMATRASVACAIKVVKILLHMRFTSNKKNYKIKQHQVKLISTCSTTQWKHQGTDSQSPSVKPRSAVCVYRRVLFDTGNSLSSSQSLVSPASKLREE